MKEQKQQEPKLNRKKKRKVKEILAWTAVVIAGLIILILVGALILTAVGKKRLRSKVSGLTPEFSIEEEVQASGESNPYVWQEGWVRYDGKIYEYNDDIMTFLVMGIDKLGTVKEAKNATDGGQADAIFLVVVNPDEKDIKIIGVNRDTMVDIYMYGAGEGGSTPVTQAQIAVQHGFGDGLELSCEATRDAVSELFYHLPINGYVAVNMGAVAKITSAVDGVDLEVLEDMTKLFPDWSVGAAVHLEGNEAYEYVHWRDTELAGSAGGRLARQKQFLTVYINKLKAKTKEDITTPVTLFNSLTKYMVTDITVDEVAYLASQVLDYNFSGESIYTLEGETRMGEKFEEFYPDMEALKKMMIEVFYREVDPEIYEAG